MVISRPSHCVPFCRAVCTVSRWWSQSLWPCPSPPPRRGTASGCRLKGSFGNIVTRGQGPRMRVGLFPSFSLLVSLRLSDISPRQAVMINSRGEGLGGEVRGRCTAGPRPSVSSGRLCMGVSRVGLSSWSPEAPLLQRASHG